MKKIASGVELDLGGTSAVRGPALEDVYAKTPAFVMV